MCISKAILGLLLVVIWLEELCTIDKTILLFFMAHECNVF